MICYQQSPPIFICSSWLYYCRKKQFCYICFIHIYLSVITARMPEIVVKFLGMRKRPRCLHEPKKEEEEEELGIFQILDRLEAAADIFICLLLRVSYYLLSHFPTKHIVPWNQIFILPLAANFLTLSINCHLIYLVCSDMRKNIALYSKKNWVIRKSYSAILEL